MCVLWDGGGMALGWVWGWPGSRLAVKRLHGAGLGTGAAVGPEGRVL